MKKRLKLEEEDERTITQAAAPWKKVTHPMSEEEIEKIKSMNWEWYYNCYLYKNETLEIMCKICGGLNIFLPGEMKKKCIHCGIECRRCEVDEEAK